MLRIALLVICLTALGALGCKESKETAARTRVALGVPSTRTPRTTPTVQVFHGLDLTTAPRTTRSSDLPDIWEERPEGSKSYEIRKDVICVYSGLDGTVYHVPDKSRFYIQSDPMGSSTMTFFGPFIGDPAKILKLDSEKAAKPIAPAK
jgi:hypothetical protein